MSDWQLESNDWGPDGRQVLANRPLSMVADISINSDSQLETDNNKEITCRHWVNNDKRPFCNNRLCRRKFSLIDRQHHCRRCGEIFCNECLKYRRKLSFLAHPDPEGKPYKVCQSCFEEGRDSDVPTRRLTPEFKSYKLRGSRRRSIEQHGSKGMTQTWRDKLDITKECQRLKHGFQKSVGSSEMKRTLQEMKNIIKTPDWQKSSAWLQENMADKCNICSQGFGLIHKKLNCKLCSKALCKSCCRRELLVYIPDDVNENTNGEPELAIIMVVVSPEVEPEISLLLHVCDPCRQFVVDQQVSRSEELLRSEVKDVEEGAISKLMTVDQPIAALQGKINMQLSKYQEIVESLEDGSKTSSDGSNMKVLAKAQDDLSDYFATIILKIQVVKKLQPESATDTQKILLRNYLKAKSEFYLDNIYTFRCMKRKLSESAPVEVLEYIQKIVDKNAIVSAQVYIRQLIFESIHLCGKYSLQERVPGLLKSLDQAIEDEAQQCLKSQGEDWPLHEQFVKDIIKAQMKDHRLIRPSRRQLSTSGPKHAADILLKRTQDILEQVRVQLNMKSVNRSFQNTKTEIERAKMEAHKLVVSDLLTSR